MSKNEAITFFDGLSEIDPKTEQGLLDLQEALDILHVGIDVKKEKDVVDNFILKQLQAWGLSKEVLPTEILFKILKNYAPKSWIKNNPEIAERLHVKDLLSLMD